MNYNETPSVFDSVTQHTVNRMSVSTPLHSSLRYQTPPWRNVQIKPDHEWEHRSKNTSLYIYIHISDFFPPRSCHKSIILSLILILRHPPVGLLPSGSNALLYGRVPPDRHPPAHPCLQHHAAEPHQPGLMGCPAGGGGGRRRPLPAHESRRRGDILNPEPLQP